VQADEHQNMRARMVEQFELLLASADEETKKRLLEERDRILGPLSQQ
jgi:hypothetical protein